MNFNLLTIIFILPSLVTLVVMRIRRKPWTEISSVLGWRWSAPVYFLWAIVFTLIITALALPFALLVAPGLYLHPSPGTTTYIYARLGLSLSSVIIALLNEFLFTALGEEVFFRGLLGGGLMKRLGFLVGNLLQTIIFLIPHLLVLFVSLRFWPLLLFPAIAGWLAGWLRYRSNSILPGMLTHGLGNTFSDIFAMVLGG